jgi:hypothetical protein
MSDKSSGASLSISLVLLLVCLIVSSIFILLVVSGTVGPLANLMGFIIGLNQKQFPRFILITVTSLSIVGFVAYTAFSLNKKR